MTLDFTINKYESLCKVLSNKKVYTLESFLINKPKSNFVILRHDIDRKPNNALKIALIENNYNIKSTYYFRVNNSTNFDVLNKIKTLGHEVGYHYEVLSKSRGDYKKALLLFENEINLLRKNCEINTICMHGSPISKYNNLNLWNQYDFKKFNVLGDAFISIDNIYYYTDSGGSWNRKDNLRDHLPKEILPVDIINTTDELINKILYNDNNYYITTHPERWSYNNIEYIINYGRDFTFNIGKKIIHRVYF